MRSVVVMTAVMLAGGSMPAHAQDPIRATNPDTLATHLSVIRNATLVAGVPVRPEDTQLRQIDIDHAQRCKDDVTAGQRFPASDQVADFSIMAPGNRPLLEAAKQINYCLVTRNIAVFVIPTAEALPTFLR